MEFDFELYGMRLKRMLDSSQSDRRAMRRLPRRGETLDDALCVMNFSVKNMRQIQGAVEEYRGLTEAEWIADVQDADLSWKTRWAAAWMLGEHGASQGAWDALLMAGNDRVDWVAWEALLAASKMIVTYPGEDHANSDL